MSAPPAPATRRDPAPGQGPLQLCIVQDAGGGLIFVAADLRGLALRQALDMPAGGLRPWTGGAWRRVAGLAAFGRALAQALLPAGMRQALSSPQGGDLRLWRD